MTTEALVIDALVKRYGATTVLHGIDLAFPAGSFVVILGPSGSGKTTLLSILGGFADATAGRVMLGARDITHLPPARRPTTTVFQDYALFPHLSVAGNVAFGLKMRRVAARECAERVSQALDMVGLGQLGERRIQDLSGGQRQRVALARALVVRPEVLLLDEPLGALDLALRRQMQDELTRIQKDSRTTFIHVTHDQDEAMSIADLIVVMNQGRVEDLGAPERLYLRPASRFSARFMGENNLIEGQVAAVDGGFARVDTALGRLVAPVGDAIATLGAPAAVALRPEQLRLTPGDGCLMLGEARIEMRAFHGTHERVLLDAQGIGLILRAPPGAPLGERIALSYRPEDAVLLTR